MVMQSGRLTVFLAMVAAGVMAASAAMAEGGRGNVAYTVHNLSNFVPGDLAGMSRYIKSNSQQQICIFCHTPHSGTVATPLWNKVMPNQSFNMYTTSTTLSATAKKATAPSQESLLCLSCHDGRTAINVLHQAGTDTNVQTHGNDTVVDISGTFDDNVQQGKTYGYSLGGLGFSDYGPNLGKIGHGATTTESYYGGNLTDDHPISFSYSDAQQEKTDKLNNLATVAAKSGGHIKFYGPTSRMECCSCHDPHVNYGADRMGNTWTAGNADPKLRPFLVMDNSTSQLCLACHIK